MKIGKKLLDIGYAVVTFASMRCGLTDDYDKIVDEFITDILDNDIELKFSPSDKDYIIVGKTHICVRSEYYYGQLRLPEEDASVEDVMRLPILYTKKIEGRASYRTLARLKKKVNTLRDDHLREKLSLEQVFLDKLSE